MKTRSAFTLVAAAATLTLTACGGENKPKPMDAVTKMQARLKEYKTIDLTVTGTTSGKPMTLKVHGPTSGTSAAESMTTDGDTIQLLQVDGTTYVKANASYLQKKGGASAQLFADRWIKDDNSDNENFLKDIIDALTKNKPSGTPNTLSAADTKVTSEKFNGQSVWKLTSKNGKDSAWIKKDTFDLLKATGTDLSTSQGDLDSETITVNKHEEYENITAPVDAVDPAQLGK